MFFISVTCEQRISKRGLHFNHALAKGITRLQFQINLIFYNWLYIVFEQFLRSFHFLKNRHLQVLSLSGFLFYYSEIFHFIYNPIFVSLMIRLCKQDCLCNQNEVLSWNTSSFVFDFTHAKLSKKERCSFHTWKKFLYQNLLTFDYFYEPIIMFEMFEMCQKRFQCALMLIN